MTRSRKTAREAGTKFETSVVRWLQQHVDGGIERRTRNGKKDRGDISGWTFAGRRIVAECKNHSRLDLAGWTAEAEIERLNDDAQVGLVIHKKRGTADPGEQYVTLTLRDLIAFISKERP